MPFSLLLNVKAAEVTITTDNTKLLESNNNFKYITNTTNLYVNGLSFSSNESNTDTFCAYKILDIYYNQNSNEMTYDFTSNFQSFINQLEEDDDFYNLSVSSYQELTGDNFDTTIYTASTLNKLVSKYATYIKNQSILGVQLENDAINSRAQAIDIETGSYLILPYPTTFSQVTYGVMVGNAVFTAADNMWQLSECNIEAKGSDNNDILTIFSNSLALENEDALYFGDIIYEGNKKIYFGGYLLYESPSLPTNTNSTIINNPNVMSLLKTTEIILPSGVDYNSDRLYLVGPSSYINLEVKENSVYFTYDNVEYKYADILISQIAEGTKITISNANFHNKVGDMLFIFELSINSNINTGTSNEIITSYNFLKDPYVDIGNNPSTDDIKKALASVSITNTIYTYGVTVTNKTGNDTLNGARFQVCLDKNCTNKVGEEFEIAENGIYTFKGLNDTNTYYLKQTRVPTGYRLLKEAIELNPTSLNKEIGIYNVEVSNNKMGLLPSTGGLGTILYTTFGLLIIVAGSITFISYRKKQIQNG